MHFSQPGQGRGNARSPPAGALVRQQLHGRSQHPRAWTDLEEGYDVFRLSRPVVRPHQ
jgi:hypothetical protein